MRFTKPTVTAFSFMITITALGCLYQATALAHTGVHQQQTVSIQVQPDSPLRISSVVNHSTDPSEINLTFAIENINRKAIRAYAVRHDDTCGPSNSKSGATTLSTPGLPKSVLHPGQSRTEEFSGERCSSTYETIVLSIDFVEFVDGSQWGPDISKSAERLDGFRAGTQEETERLLAVLKASGALAVVRAIGKEIQEGIRNEDRSQIWNEGFRAGVGGVRGRIKHSYEAKGLGEIEQSLKEPFGK
jgi:hypothetical protein